MTDEASRLSGQVAFIFMIGSSSPSNPVARRTGSPRFMRVSSLQRLASRLAEVTASRPANVLGQVNQGYRRG
jgi:hypothetical protein